MSLAFSPLSLEKELELKRSAFSPRDVHCGETRAQYRVVCVCQEDSKGLTKITSVILPHLVYMWPRNKV